MRRLICWFRGHQPPVYRYDVAGHMGFCCPRCHTPQALTELPEIAANKVNAERRAAEQQDRDIVATRERQVEARRQRDQLRLVKRA